MTRLLTFAAALALALSLALPAEAATPTVAVGAHLEAPHPPYVFTVWTINIPTRQSVRTQAWIAKVNCQTGALIYNAGFTSGVLTNAQGRYLVVSGQFQVFAGDCLIPAGNALNPATGAVLVSTVGPLYRW